MFNSHDGHGNPAPADPRHKVRIVPTIYYEGVHGFGASFNYSYKPGPVTLFSIGSIGEGQFLEMKPRDISAPQTFFQREGGDIREFSERWLCPASSHHHTAAYGKLTRVLGYVGQMLEMQHVIV